LGDFGGIARLGLREFLDDEGFDVVAGDATLDALVDRVGTADVDVVVIDLDADGAIAVASDLVASFPGVRVIACSSEQPTMRVFPAYRSGESYEAELEPASLAAALRSNE
jgi:DNA-binding NarL/FixJ family response regulator